MICGGSGVFVNFADLGAETELLVRAAHRGKCDRLRAIERRFSASRSASTPSITSWMSWSVVTAAHGHRRMKRPWPRP